MLKRILRSVREYKTASFLTMIFITLEVAMECVLPFITAKLVDQMQKNDAMELVIYSVVLVVMALFSLLFGALSGLFCAKASAGFAKNLRKDMYEKITSYSFSNIDKFQASSLVTRMTTDVMSVQNAYMMVIRTAIRSPLILIFSFIMSFIMAPSLAWVFVIVMPILIIGIYTIMFFAVRIFKRIFKKYDALNESIKENIDGIRVVKSFVREDYEIEKFNKSAKDLQRDFTRAERLINLNGPIMQFCINSLMIIILTVGSILIVNNSTYDVQTETYNFLGVSVGELQSLFTYGFQSLLSLMMLSMIFVMITMSIEAGKRINEVLSEEPTLHNPENPIYEITDGSVEFKNVSFKYNQEAEKFALSNVNLKIESGETIGIIGSTGSSKTTLVNLISRLYDTTDGEVIVAGHNVKEYDLKALRNSVSVVLQKNLLFSGTIYENLRWGDENATDEEVEEVARLACCMEFIEKFPDGFNTKIDQGGANVSGGQRQRLCIARALLKKPKILILDDSTSAVDTKTDAKIRDGLKKYMPETTKIIIAQRVASVMDADKIIIMDNGKINQVGNHDELLKSNKIYQEVYYSQNNVSNKRSGGEVNA